MFLAWQCQEDSVINARAQQCQDMIPKLCLSSSTTSSKSSSASSKKHSYSVRKRCRVPHCPNPDCKLATHQEYVPARLVTHHGEPGTGDAASAALNQLSVKKNNIDIPRDGVDGMPVLPGDHQANLKVKLLFHHFFDSVFEPLALIFRGSSVGSMAEYKARMLSTALTSEGYCMGLVVQSQADINIKTNAFDESRQSLDVYTTAVAAFRRQLASIQQLPNPLQIELALLVLCTLLSYDALHDRLSSIVVHWSGLQRLVELRGGLHCVTISLAYVVHVDRLCAQRLNRRPLCSTYSIHTMPLPRPGNLRYGSSLRHYEQLHRTMLEPRIMEYCIDTCGLIEIWELSHGQSAAHPPNKRSQPVPSIEYQHFMRDRLDEQFTILHADRWDNPGMSECLLWSTRLVEYPLTWWNQTPTMNTHICGHLVRALKKQDLERIWEGKSNMLLWIFFVLAVVQMPFDGRDWVIKRLQNMISTKYGSQKWPSDWWVGELENVQGFVWCNSHLANRYRNLCNELEAVLKGETIAQNHTLSNQAYTSRHSDPLI